MKKYFFLISAVAWLISCNSGLDITIENPSSFDRSEMAEIAVERLMRLPDGKTYVVVNQQENIVPSQITYDGKLIFQTEIKAKETLSYTIKTGSPQAFPPKTYGRFITERKDDFAWENDCVAFRIYGPALVKVDGPSNGLDFWYKKTNNLIIDKWYKDDLAGIRSYHEDHGEGLDDYKVGRTLGGGMMAPFENDTLILNGNFVTQEILENGPLRTTFKLTYKDITVNEKTFGESRTFSINAGSQLTKVTQEYGVNDTITVAAGLVKRSEEDEAYQAYTENGTAAIIYEEPDNEKVGKVFVGMIFPKGLERITSNTYTIIHDINKKEVTHSHVLGVTSYYPNQPITYYTGFGWEKFGFPTLDSFQNYIGIFSVILEEPLIVKFL
ncbi:MAG: DUF4861 domain-containing protein [Tannerella sp.]|jgi:hypothetical protein|nr:DUF4861 domain-containing protein [Tannerella sp.]